jgi:biotin operon repressor
MNSSANAKLSIEGQWGAIPRGMAKLLDAPHFKTYAALAFFADAGTRQCYPSMTRLAEETGSNRATVKAHIRTLCAIGAITKLRKGGYRAEGRNDANTYRINDCAAVLAATGLTEAMLDTIKPADISWVVKARAGCEVPQRCPSESSLPAQQRGKAEAYRLALKGVGVPETPTVGVSKAPTVGVPETPTVGVSEAYITEHVTDHTTDHLTEQSVTDDTNSLSEDSYGAESESITAQSESNEPLGSEEDVYMPNVSSVSHTPEGRDSAQADITSPAADTQAVPVNGRCEHATPRSAADGEQWSHARELVSYAMGPYEVDVALLAKVPICYQDDICKALAARDVDVLYGPMNAARVASDDDLIDAMNGKNVVLPKAPQWFVAVCKELGLSITATEVYSEAA